MRLIDADELTEMVWRERLDTRERIANLIARQPTIKRSVKRGHWEISSDGYYPYCSECGFRPKGMSKFCPDCGADMRGEPNE